MMTGYLDIELACPQCDAPVWSSQATEVSRTEFEWECGYCDSSVYVELSAYDG